MACRFDVQGVGVDDPASDAAVRHVLRPLPPSMRRCAGPAAREAAAFAAWRRRAAGGANRARRPACRGRLADTAPHHAFRAGSQLGGHFVVTDKEVSAVVRVNVLAASVDSGLLRRILLACCPEAAGAGAAAASGPERPPGVSSHQSTGSPFEAAGAVPFSTLTPAADEALAVAVDGKSPLADATTAFSEGENAAGHVHLQPMRLQPQRSVKLQLAADCGHVDLLAEGTRLATITWHHLEVRSLMHCDLPSPKHLCAIELHLLDAAMCMVNDSRLLVSLMTRMTSFMTHAAVVQART